MNPKTKQLHIVFGKTPLYDIFQMHLQNEVENKLVHRGVHSAGALLQLMVLVVMDKCQ